MWQTARAENLPSRRAGAAAERPIRNIQRMYLDRHIWQGHAPLGILTQGTPARPRVSALQSPSRTPAALAGRQTWRPEEEMRTKARGAEPMDVESAKTGGVNLVFVAVVASTRIRSTLLDSAEGGKGR
jgi:hypothetical protein